MSHKEAQRRSADQLLLAELSKIKGWVGALALADRLGWPWRVVSRALHRLAVLGVIEAQASEWKSKRSRMRKTTIYRLPPANSIGTLPAWLEPRAGPAIGGRVVRLCQDDEP